MHVLNILTTSFIVLLGTSTPASAALTYKKLPISIQQNTQQNVILPEPDSKSSLDDVISASPLLSFHRALVEVESISSNELAVAKLVISTLEAHNFTVTTQQVDDYTNSSLTRWNVYAVPDVTKYPFNLYAAHHHDTTSKKTPKVILSSHIDTVPPYIPYSVSQPKHTKKRSDILISGRGTVDDKACVAAQFLATLELLSDPENDIDPSSIALLFVVGEETRGDGMKTFSDSSLYQDTLRSSVKGIIFGEPTERKLAAGHKGITMVHILAKGKAAHSGYPWLGKSANSMILPTLLMLDTLGDIPEHEGGLPRSKLFGNSTVNVGYIQGGIAANVVPAHAEAKISFRLAGGTASSVQKIIRKAIAKTDPYGELELDFFQGYGPVPLDTDVKGFESIVVNYGTDVINLDVDVEGGVKRYLYGPGSILVAHGDDEGLTVGDMEGAVVDYKRLVRHVLAL